MSPGAGPRPARTVSPEGLAPLTPWGLRLVGPKAIDLAWAIQQLQQGQPWVRIDLRTMEPELAASRRTVLRALKRARACGLVESREWGCPRYDKRSAGCPTATTWEEGGAEYRTRLEFRVVGRLRRQLDGTLRVWAVASRFTTWSQNLRAPGGARPGTGPKPRLFKMALKDFPAAPAATGNQGLNLFKMAPLYLYTKHLECVPPLGSFGTKEEAAAGAAAHLPVRLVKTPDQPPASPPGKPSPTGHKVPMAPTISPAALQHLEVIVKANLAREAARAAAPRPPTPVDLDAPEEIIPGLAGILNRRTPVEDATHRLTTPPQPLPDAQRFTPRSPVPSPVENLSPPGVDRLPDGPAVVLALSELRRFGKVLLEEEDYLAHLAHLNAASVKNWKGYAGVLASIRRLAKEPVAPGAWAHWYLSQAIERGWLKRGASAQQVFNLKLCTKWAGWARKTYDGPQGQHDRPTRANMEQHYRAAEIRRLNNGIPPGLPALVTTPPWYAALRLEEMKQGIIDPGARWPDAPTCGELFF